MYVLCLLLQCVLFTDIDLCVGSFLSFFIVSVNILSEIKFMMMIARYWSPLFGALVEGDPIGVSPRSVAAENWSPLAIIWRYLLDAGCQGLRLAVLVQYRRVTNRQTDGWVHG